MNAKKKIEELLEASEDGTITASGAACMCGAAHGRTISTSCSASMGAGFAAFSAYQPFFNSSIYKSAI